MKLEELFGVQYHHISTSNIITSPLGDAYYYRVFVGPHKIQIEPGDCVFYINQSQDTALVQRGPITIESPHWATVIRGFAPENKSSEIRHGSNLPYVNGCSTRQVFPAERPGDPTLQLLRIPPYTKEQAHHIHSTARVVFVLSGRGTSVVGMKDKMVHTELRPGVICILDKMCPHHFETQEEWLTVLPVHIWSSFGDAEHHHAMKAGTFMLAHTSNIE